MTATQLTEKPAQQIAAVLMGQDFKRQLIEAMGSEQVVDRFRRIAMRAIQEDPKLLSADRNSLYLACQAAAIDGLMPDGREGKLVTYKTKAGNNWIDKVQWQRMVGGLRVLSARHGFDLLANAVHENDAFDYELGSAPAIHHKPARLGQDRGPVIGYYAIATHTDTGKQYLEVMDAAQVDVIMARTKSKDQQGNIIGPWATDKVEMGRKTVAKRLFKSLPLYDADDLQAVIKRDNEEYVGALELADEPTQEAPAALERPSALQAVVDAEKADEYAVVTPEGGRF